MNAFYMKYNFVTVRIIFCLIKKKFFFLSQDSSSTFCKKYFAFLGGCDISFRKSLSTFDWYSFILKRPSSIPQNFKQPMLVRLYRSALLLKIQARNRRDLAWDSFSLRVNVTSRWSTSKTFYISINVYKNLMKKNNVLRRI